MGSMQDKVLPEMERRAVAAGFDTVVNFNTGNAGLLLVLDGWEPVLTAGFDFQAGTCRLRYSGTAMEAWKRTEWQDGPGARWDPHNKAITAWQVKYAVPGEVAVQLGMFTAMLGSVKPSRPAADESGALDAIADTLRGWDGDSADAGELLGEISSVVESTGRETRPS